MEEYSVTVFAKVDNLLDDFIAGFGPLGEIKHFLRDRFPEKGVSVLQQAGAVDSFGFATT